MNIPLKKSYDVEGYAMRDGYCLCPNCASNNTKNKGTAIFADQETDSDMVCDNCQEVIIKKNIGEENDNT